MVEGIGGSVSDSHVNNIEVNHGGSVVIDKHSNCGGKTATATSTASVKSPENGKSVTIPGSTEKPPKELGAKSQKLKSTKKEPNAVTRLQRDVPSRRNVPSKAGRNVPSRGDVPRRGKTQSDKSKPVTSSKVNSYASERVAEWGDDVEPMEVDDDRVDPTPIQTPRSARQLQQAIAKKHGQRTQKEKEKMLLDTLKVAKVKELQGEKGKQEMRNRKEQEREIVHELRDIYRGELKKEAGRRFAGPRNAPEVDRKKDLDGADSIPDRGRKRIKTGKSLTPSAALSSLSDQGAKPAVGKVLGGGGVKRAVNDEWLGPDAKRQKSLPKPWLIREKRPSSPSWDESSRKKSKSLPKPWLIREKRSPSPSWEDGGGKRLKSLPKPWLIREKRAPPSSWPTSGRKRSKRADDDATTDDDEDGDDGSSDDGNDGKYKVFLDKIARKKVKT